jgi:hypothetical protein
MPWLQRSGVTADFRPARRGRRQRPRRVDRDGLVGASRTLKTARPTSRLISRATESSAPAKRWRRSPRAAYLPASCLIFSARTTQLRRLSSAPGCPRHGRRSACKCPGAGAGCRGSRSPAKPSSPSPGTPFTRPARRHRGTRCTLTFRRRSEPPMNPPANSAARIVTAWHASSGEPAATTAHTTSSRRPRCVGPSRLYTWPRPQLGRNGSTSTGSIGPSAGPAASKAT